MMRIVVLAYACKSGAGSEPGAGFLWALAAAQVGSVHVITRPLDAETRRQLMRAGISVHELNIRHAGFAPQLSYVQWLLSAQVKLRELHRVERFEIVHHVTYATDWLPSPSIKGIPLIWGPVGGSTGLPPKLGPHFSLQLRTKELARSLITGSVRMVTRGWASRRVTTLIAQNADTARNYHRLGRVYVRPNYIVQPPGKRAAEPSRNRIAMAGRLIEMKGVHLAIEALASGQLRDWELHVIGDGPMRSRLEHLARSYDVGAQIVFHGQCTRQEVYEQLELATCSLLLSTHDAAGWAAAESIAVGTPVHTWSHGGPAELVSRTGCGSVIHPGDNAVQLLAEAITHTETPVVADMSAFTFSAVVQDLRTWYDEAIK